MTKKGLLRSDPFPALKLLSIMMKPISTLKYNTAVLRKSFTYK